MKDKYTKEDYEHAQKLMYNPILVDVIIAILDEKDIIKKKEILDKIVEMQKKKND